MKSDGIDNIPATFEVGLPAASKTGPSQVTSKKLLNQWSAELRELTGNE